MPETASGAPVALTTPSPPSRTTRALRLAVGTVFAVAALAVPASVDPAPAAAGSCTGWTSKAKPPKTIRVLRTRSGKVEKVNFRRYVAEVMASGEWPSRLKMATLEAGALATKQYAWYYALKGNHRSWYVSRGKCYDVRDDVRDQLYRPNRAKPTTRQWKAIDKTWDLTLRKNGRFFLTGYRAGSTETCAADANGWKLYAKSVNSCARKGWSSKRILDRYLSPNLAFVWSDKSGPVIEAPGLRLRAGNTLPSAATLSWKPVRKAANVSRYKVQRKIGKGKWTTVGRKQAKKMDVWLKPGARNRFRVRAFDGKGNRGPWAYSKRRKPDIRGPVGITLSGGATAANEPRKAKIRFKARAVGFITETGPGMGKAKIFVNGRKVAVVDLERKKTTKRKLVWTKNWPKKRSRSVAVKAVDTNARVDFEGFYILR